MKRRIALLFSLVTALSLPARAVCVPPASRVVDHYLIDSILHRRWAVVVDCRHPEQPWKTEEVAWVETKGSSVAHAQNAAPLLLMVQAGSPVEIRARTTEARLQLKGVALEAGRDGDAIHVRLQYSPAVLLCRVRGSGSVELIASSRWEAQ